MHKCSTILFSIFRFSFAYTPTLECRQRCQLKLLLLLASLRDTRLFWCTFFPHHSDVRSVTTLKCCDLKLQFSDHWLRVMLFLGDYLNRHAVVNAVFFNLNALHVVDTLR